MKRLSNSLICMICLIFCSTFSHAANNSNMGFSLGLGGSVIFENFDTDFDELSFDESFGLDLKAGYRISDNFAFELDYLIIDGFKGEAYDTELIEIDGHAVTANAKFYPFTGQVQPYGLLGLGIADLELKDTRGVGLSDSESDTVIRAGAGVDVVFNSNVSFFTELSYYLIQNDFLTYIEDTDFMPITAGVKITF